MRTDNDCGQSSGHCWEDMGQLGGSTTSHHDAACPPPADFPVVRSARLVRTVEAEIVPRLMLMRRPPLVSTDRSSSNSLTDHPDVIELTRILLAHDAEVAAAFVEALMQGGQRFQRICLEVLAPSARRLGVMWEQDECDFMQVTLGLCRLHQVLHQLNTLHGVLPDSEIQAQARCALIAPLPGEQHTFGVVMVSQFLRVAGWDVCNEFPKADVDLAKLVRDRWFAVAGLSVGSQAHLTGIGSAIKAIRQASRNRAICVLVGGPIFVGHPELASALGADATASDGRAAVQVAEKIFASLVAPH